MTDSRIETVTTLFAAWSSGDVDAPEHYFHPDGVLDDIVGGRYEGWPAIRAFFAQGLARWPDLILVPDAFWTNDTGVAVRWMMSATVPNEKVFGPEHVGKTWKSAGLSHIDFVDGRIALEVDFHDGSAVARSLGITVTR
jgi:ketosteroid isomerase-like protein